MLLATICLALGLSSAEKMYSPRSEDETEILSLVLSSEVQANQWTEKELICFSVDEKNPSPKLVRALRQRDLNVCSSGEWPKKSNCGFEVRLRFLGFHPALSARVHAEVADFREINEGVAHVAVRLRDGDYTVRKIGGKWSISEYIRRSDG